MRLPVVVVIAGVSSGCMFDLWAGANAVKHPNETTAGFAIGASIGAYIDPVATRTKIGVAVGTDRNYTGGDTASKLTQNMAQIRLDVGLSPSQRSEYDNSSLKRITAIVSYRGDAFSNNEMLSVNPMDPNMTVERDRSRVFGLYAGYTSELVQDPGRIWRDSVAWSVGPTYSRWREGDDGEVQLFGVQARLTLNFSPLVVFSILGTAGKGVAEVSKSATPGAPGGPASSTPSTSGSTSGNTDGCPGGYYADKCDYSGKNCKSVWTCP